jgi:hypothetical protein
MLKLYFKYSDIYFVTILNLRVLIDLNWISRVAG